MKSRSIAAISLMLASVLAGCSPLFSDLPSTSVSPSGVPSASPLSASPTEAPEFTFPPLPTKTRTFTSPLYGYTAALPAGWSTGPGERWGGTGAPGPVDVFRGQPNVAIWAFAVARPASPAAYATAVTKAAAQLPCPAAPSPSHAVTIGGVPAGLISMRCPARGGVLMLTAFTLRGPSILVVTFEDGSGFAGTEGVDRAAFSAFLSGIRLRA